MKIVQFIDSLQSGGKERQLVELLKGLSDKDDIECELIIMSEDIHYSYLSNLNFRPHFLLRNSRKDLSIFPRLYHLCKEIKPDILHSWSSMCSVYAIPVVKTLGIKFVNGFLRDVLFSFSLHRKNWLRAKISFPFSDAIVANSIAGLKAYHVNPSKAYFVHNGFDMNRVANLKATKEIQSMLGINTDKVVGMVASFSEYKDHNTFITAAQKILSRRSDVSFVLVGDGDNLQACQKKVLPRFRSQIKFLGKKKQVEEIVNIFTVGVLCSTQHGEGISNSIMEYMALKKPVVATRCDGSSEIVVDGKTGFLVTQENPEELTAKIEQLLDDDLLAEQFGEAGQRRIVSEFSLEKMTSQYASLYREILRN